MKRFYKVEIHPKEDACPKVDKAYDSVDCKAYTGGPENIVDFDNNYRCCNCDGYDDHALAPTYYDGAKEKQEVIKAKLEKWCYNNLFTGTYCVETSFETIDELLEDLFKYLDL